MNLNIRIHQIATLASGVLFASVCVAHFNKPAPANTLLMTENQPPEVMPISKTAINAGQLAKLHIFGVATKELSSATTTTNTYNFYLTDKIVDPAKLPATRLDISIDGVFTHEDFNKGHAIISDAKGETRSYKVGDNIQSNVKLHSVYTDYVVVNNNNKLESLKLPEFRTSGANTRNQDIKRNFARQFADRKRDS